MMESGRKADCPLCFRDFEHGFDVGPIAEARKVLATIEFTAAAANPVLNGILPPIDHSRFDGVTANIQKLCGSNDI